MTGEERLKYLLQKLTSSKDFSFDEANWEKMKTMLPDNEEEGEAEFKNSLNNLIEAKTFPFDEKNWEKMKELLPVREKKRRFAFILLAGLFVLGVWFISQQFEFGSRQSAETSSKSQVITHELKAESLKSEVGSKQFVTNKPFNHQNLETSQQKETKQKLEVVGPQLAVDSEQLASDELSTSNIQRNTNVETSEQEETNLKSEIVNTQLAVDSLKTGVVNKHSTSNIPLNTNVEASEQEKTNQKSEIGSIVMLAEEASQKTDSLFLRMTDTKREVINEHLASDELSTSNFQLNTKKDTMPKTPVDTIKTVISEIPKAKKAVMYFEAGGDYLLGWKNAGATEGKSFNPAIGFNYYNYLNEKWALSLGGQYTSVNNLNNYSNTSKVTSYVFGEESAVTVITPQKIHYLLAPIKLHYFMNEKNSFGFGFNFAYLLTVDSRMETYNIHFGKKENYQIGKTNGYTEGFNMFDTQVALFYHRRLYKNIGAVAELFYGLSDVKNDLFFKTSLKEHNRGVKFTLTYTILK